MKAKLKLEDRYLILTAVCVALTIILAMTGCGEDLEKARTSREAIERHNRCDRELTECVSAITEGCEQTPGCVIFIETGCLDQRDACEKE